MARSRKPRDSAASASASERILSPEADIPRASAASAEPWGVRPATASSAVAVFAPSTICVVSASGCSGSASALCVRAAWTSVTTARSRKPCVSAERASASERIFSAVADMPNASAASAERWGVRLDAASSAAAISAACTVSAASTSEGFVSTVAMMSRASVSSVETWEFSPEEISSIAAIRPPRSVVIEVPVWPPPAAGVVIGWLADCWVNLST